MIYNRYFIKSIFPPLIIVTLVLTTLVWITQMMRLLYLLDKGVSVFDFLSLVILIVPSLLFSVMPLITLLACIYVYNKLREEKQIMILKSTGLSDRAIAKPALFVSTLLTIFSLFLSAYLMPLSYNILKSRLSMLRNNYISSILDVRKFNQVSKYTTVYIDGRDEDGNLKGIVLFDNSEPESNSVLFARYGDFLFVGNEIQFELHEGLRQAYDNNGNITRMHFDNLIVRIANDTQEVEQRIKNSLELYIDEMLDPDDSLPPEKRMQLIAEGHNRIIWPVFNFVFVLISLSIFLKMKFARHFQWQAILKSVLPILFISLVHFTLNKYSYSQPNFIYLCYVNVLVCFVFSFWQLERKIL